MAKKRIRDPRSPQLFSNDELGLPPEEMEYRGSKIVVNKHGKRVRIAIITGTKEEFVRQAREVHGDHYDYTDSVYEDKLKPITIYCPKHDLHFTVAMAQNHLMKHNATGCPVCQYEQQYGVEYGPEWRDYLKLSPKNNRVGVIRPAYVPMTEKRRERERIEREQREQRKQQREREEREYMAKYHAKNLPEARFIEKVHQQYPDLDTALVDYIDKDHRVTLICPLHGMFEITPRQMFANSDRQPPHGCWKCAGLEDPAEKFVLTAKDFNQRMQNLYGLKGLTFPQKRKIKPTDNITAVCRKHGEIVHNAMWWYHGKGCEYCNGKFYPPDFLRLARAAQGEEYQYRGVENIKTASDRVMVHCGNPKHQWHLMRIYLVLQGCKCRECAGRHQSLETRVSNFITRSDEKYRGEFDYGEVANDYVNNDSKVWLTHKSCGTRFQVTPDTHLRGVNGGCPTCNTIYLESEGERIIRLWLEDHHIDHDCQHKLPNEDETLPLQYLKTDFWLDDFDGRPLVIEYNGQQHYEPINFFHEGRRDFDVQQHRDRYLRQYCHDNRYRLLEIPYWEFDHIADILQSVILNHEPIPTFLPPENTDVE